MLKMNIRPMDIIFQCYSFSRPGRLSNNCISSSANHQYFNLSVLNSAESREMSALTLCTLCLPCCMSDVSSAYEKDI